MKPIRWWPAAVILALALVSLGYVWLSDMGQRQDRNIGTIIVLGSSLILLALWLLLFSRLPGKVRLGLFGALLVVGFVVRSTVRIGGVSGDWIPQLEWRGSAGSEAIGPPQPAAPREIRQLAAASAQDFPQFLGPERNGKVRGVRLARDWSAQPPKLMWRREVGPAWSGFAVVGQIAVTQEQRGEREMVVAYDLASGEQLWSQGSEARFETILGGTGPRATPTITEGKVYTMGAFGLLSCLDLATGDLRWSRDVVEEHRSGMPDWGRACSPLVAGDLVVVTAGGAGRALVAYDKETGEPRWHGGDERPSYSSPFLAEIAGVPQIVIFHADSVAGHDPGDGSVLWRQPWPSLSQPCVAQPLLLDGDRLLVSSGYGVGVKLYEIAAGDGGLEATMVWESPRLKAKFSQMLEHRGSVYGLDDGVLVCLDPETGERCWKKGRYGHGQALLADDLLLVQTERGEVVLIEAVPEEHRELGRFRAVSGKAWNTMALAGPYLLVRTAKEAACFELPTSPSDV